MDGQGEQMKHYQQIAKFFKQLVDSITTLQLGQLKLYFINLQKKIVSKQSNVVSQYDSLKSLLNNLKQAKGRLAIHFAVAGGNLQTVRHMIQSIGVDYNVKDKQGSSPYFIAVQHGHVQLVQYFIRQLKLSVNQTKEGDIVPLHIAANHNNVDFINFLISEGANIEKLSIYGKPINWAVGNRHVEATKALLDHGADPNGDSTGSNLAPLILAVDYNEANIYNLLVQKGANVNIKDPSGFSVLHVAAQKGSLQFVKDLINRGAQPNLQVDGKTPFYLAFQNSKWPVVNYLKEKEPNYESIQKKVLQQYKKKEKLVANPTLAEQIKNKGNVLYSQKNYQGALNEYLQAIKHDEQNEIIHRNIAACYLNLKKYEEALMHCQQAKKKNNKNVKTIYREAQAYIGLGNLIQASSSMWQCCLIQQSNPTFKAQFLRLVEEAKKKHKQQQS